MLSQEYLPFDLEKALAGWPVVTREGRPVTQLHHFTDATCMYTNLVGVTDDMLHRWLPDGRYVSDTKDYDLDLFLLPQPAGTEVGSGYLNIYHNHEAYLYPTKELADAGSCDVRRHACVAVKWIKKP